jgi:hypothetical protein
MLGIDEGGHATCLLGLGDDLQSDGRLAGRLRAKDFNHASAGEAANTESGVERDCAGRDHGDGNDCFFRAQSHD